MVGSERGQAGIAAIVIVPESVHRAGERCLLYRVDGRDWGEGGLLVSE